MQGTCHHGIVDMDVLSLEMHRSSNILSVVFPGGLQYISSSLYWNGKGFGFIRFTLCNFTSQFIVRNWSSKTH